MIKKEEDYTFIERLIAGFANTNARWRYATKVEKLAMKYVDFTEGEIVDFENAIKELEQEKINE